MVVPPTTVAPRTRGLILEGIRGISLGGDTCISCGIEEGLVQLGQANGGVSRMVVLSDGDANHGVRDVPGFRAKFLELYHGRYLRPTRDYLVASLEHLLPVVARVPRLYNGVVGSGMGGAGMRVFGLVDTPKLSGIDLGRELAARGLAFATPEALRRLVSSTASGSTP